MVSAPKSDQDELYRAHQRELKLKAQKEVLNTIPDDVKKQMQERSKKR